MKTCEFDDEPHNEVEEEGVKCSNCLEFVPAVNEYGLCLTCEAELLNEIELEQATRDSLEKQF